MGYFFLFVVFLGPVTSQAVDLDFRFKEGYCQKAKAPGTNPEFFGECGNLTKSRFINKSFKDLNLRGGVFNSSYFYVTEIEGGVLSNASFRRSILLQTTIRNVEAEKMDVRGSHFKSVDFSNSELPYFFATGTRFNKVNFSGCNLKKANFWGSLLQEVNFQGADLRGANLSRTFLLFANLNQAKFNDETQLPFSQEEAEKKGMVKVD